MCPPREQNADPKIDPHEWLVAFEMAMWLLECPQEYLVKRIIADKCPVIGGLRKSMYLRWSDVLRWLRPLTPAEIKQRLKLQEQHLIDPDLPLHYKEAAALAGVDPRWVWRMISKNRLDASDGATSGKGVYKRSLVRFGELLALMKETGRASRYSDHGYFTQGMAALPAALRRALSP